MPVYEHTDVYCLKSIEDVETFCTHLQRMKQEAPWSLHLTVALTATRDVEFRGNGQARHVGQDLHALTLELSQGNASNRPLRVTRSSRAKSKRRLDPKGY